jgi:signal transduction histidine kinase
MITAPENYGGELPAVYNSAQHLRDLIDDVLDLARIDAQKFALSREKVAISALAQEALNMTTRAMSPPKASTCRPKSIGRREENDRYPVHRQRPASVHRRMAVRSPVAPARCKLRANKTIPLKSGRLFV